MLVSKTCSPPAHELQYYILNCLLETEILFVKFTGQHLIHSRTFTVANNIGPNHLLSCVFPAEGNVLLLPETL